MAFVLPPPKNKKQADKQGAYRTYVNAHSQLKPYAARIFYWASQYGLDPVYFASLIQFEGGFGGKRSDRGATGLGQVTPGKTPPWLGRPLTVADLQKPDVALHASAWYFAQGVAKYGSYQAAYNNYYNPGYKPGAHGYIGPVFADIPKGYVPTGTASSPAEAAQRSVETGVVKADLTDPYVTIRNGKLVKSDAKHALKVFGQPLRRSQFLNTWQNLNDLYLAYTGKPVTNRAVVDILTSGKSKYKIIDILTRGPNFVNSPVWKQNAPGYQAVWSSVYGPGKVDNGAIRYAIVNNLGGEGFAQLLRKRPDYVTSNEFKSNTATMSGVYTKIFGVPDQNAVNIIKQATISGWSQDQFADWLRHSPEYGHSEEYQGKALYFAQQLGLVTGDVPTLTPGPAPTGAGAPPLPQDPRLPSATTPNPNSTLAVSK